jgi:malonyl-CoA/methylmalonyl-CoA synthetase
MTGNLYDLIRGRFPDDLSTPAIILADGATLSYGELARMIDTFAGILIGCGVEPGDRVMVQAPKTVETVALYLACLKSGGVYVPLNTAYTPGEVEHFKRDASPRLFVDDPAELLARDQGNPPLRRTIPRTGDDLASIIYTSGTTGRSKGAMLSHENLAANALALVDAWDFEPDDVLLHALPIFHVHGLFVALHCALLSGASLLWLPAFEASAVLRLLPRATVMMGVPTFYTRLLSEPGFTREAAAGVRLFISGSAPLLPTTFDAFRERTGHNILERYGMSEAGMITSNPLHGDRVPGSVGYPLPGVSVRIDRPDEGSTGVIEIQGPNVFKGYWQMPEKTAEEFSADGWFRTGDVGRLDPDGRLWISGRAKDLIISGGLNVYPKEIELVLDSLAGVSESAVIGVPHPDFGEAVVAVVQGTGEEAALLEQLRGELAGFKLPKRILFVDELPRNAMGKVQKNVLRERYADLFA